MQDPDVSTPIDAMPSLIGNFIFEDELYFAQDEAHETIDGYLIATDMLVERMEQIVKEKHMKKILKSKNDFRETVIVLAFAFLWNAAVYLGARQIAQFWHHYDMTTSIDRLVPFLPWTVSIYFGCYLFWCINYYLCAVQERTERDRFFCADALAKGICFLLFLLIPATNIRPEIIGDTIWDALMKLLYSVDAADNLFPSIHCLVSRLCWIGVRKRKDIPVLYQLFSLAMAVAVCLSTLTTRQHVIADVIGGVALAEASYILAGYTKIRRYYSNSISPIKSKLFPYICFILITVLTFYEAPQYRLFCI